MLADASVSTDLWRLGAYCLALKSPTRSGEVAYSRPCQISLCQDDDLLGNRANVPRKKAGVTRTGTARPAEEWLTWLQGTVSRAAISVRLGRRWYRHSVAVAYRIAASPTMVCACTPVRVCRPIVPVVVRCRDRPGLLQCNGTRAAPDPETKGDAGN